MIPSRLLLFLIIPLLLVSSCQPSSKETEAIPTEQVIVPETIGWNGKALFPIPGEGPSARRNDSLLLVAQEAYQKDSNQLENIIWLGRRTAYLMQYRAAIAIYTEGLKKFPDSPELLRHRGHRYISIRMFDKAIADFKKAAPLLQGLPLQIEADGLPNALNQPLSNLQFNIYYHWGLAHYLRGEYAKAAKIYEQCMNFSNNPDLLVATSDWLYMTYQRLGETDKASELLTPITADLTILENNSYHQRLQLYQGKLSPEDLLDLDQPDEADQLDIITSGYGVGNWYFTKGDTATAKGILEQIIATDYWPAFGYIAAEKDLQHLMKNHQKK